MQGLAAGGGYTRSRGRGDPVSAIDLHARYATGASTPEDVAETALDAVAASEARQPPLRILIACDPADVRRQAAASTARCGPLARTWWDESYALTAMAAWEAHWPPPLQRLIACDPADMRREAAALSPRCLAHDQHYIETFDPYCVLALSAVHWIQGEGINSMQRECMGKALPGTKCKAIHKQKVTRLRYLVTGSKRARRCPCWTGCRTWSLMALMPYPTPPLRAHPMCAPAQPVRGHHARKCRV